MITERKYLQTVIEIIKKFYIKFLAKVPKTQKEIEHSRPNFGFSDHPLIKTAYSLEGKNGLEGFTCKGSYSSIRYKGNNQVTLVRDIMREIGLSKVERNIENDRDLAVYRAHQIDGIDFADMRETPSRKKLGKRGKGIRKREEIVSLWVRKKHTS